ncbi:MAG: alpha/beta hydrolase [Prochlorococcaceae cyanobacterium]
MTSLRRRQRLLACLLGLGLSLAGPAAQAAENLVFVSGAFRRSIPVSDLVFLAESGQARGLLADVLRFSNQKPEEVSALLNQSLSLPVTLVSRLLNTRIGEALLERMAQIFHPLKAPGAGVPALRSAIVLGLAEGNGELSAISFLQAYPTQELEVNIPNLLALVQRASSVTELVRFFSESPLDGLRGSNGAEN